MLTMSCMFHHALLALLAVLLHIATVSSLDGEGAPRFTSISPPKLVAPRSEVQLECAAEPADAAITWLRHGQLVEPSAGVTVSEGSLTIHSFTGTRKRSDQEGEDAYYCIASTSVASVRSLPMQVREARLSSFRDQAGVASTHAIQGNTAVIQCSPPDSTPPATIQFEFNNTIIDRNTEHYQLMPSGNLHISNVQVSDEGIYRCVAVNPVLGTKKASKLRFELNVTVPSRPSEVRIVARPADVTATLGGSMTLECAMEGWPLPNITWAKYGGQLPEGRYRQVLGNLMIWDIRKQDQGTYLCDNHVGKNPQARSIVGLEELPSITVPLTDTTAQIGQSLTMRCVGKGKPEPKLTWLFNAQDLPNDNTIFAKDNVLEIRNVQARHMGVYQCVVSSRSAVVHSQAMLTVIESPFTSTDSTVGAGVIRQTIDVKEGEVVTMTCYGNQTSDDQLAWFKNSQIINPSDRLALQGNSLVISSAGEDDSGRYTCINTESKEQLSLYHLTVDSYNMPTSDRNENRRKNKKEKNKKKKKGDRHNDRARLEPPTAPHVEQYSRNSVTLTWDVPENDGLAIRFFRIQYQNMGKNGESLSKRGRPWGTVDEDILPNLRTGEVTTLKSGNMYRFRIAAGYENGDNNHSRSSKLFLVRANPIGTVGRGDDATTHAPIPPSVATVRALNETTMLIRWNFVNSRLAPADGFLVEYRPTVQAGPFYVVKVTEPQLRSQLLVHLLPHTTYEIRLQAFNGAGRSSYSPMVEHRTKSARAMETHQDVAHDSEEEASNELLFIILGSVLGGLIIILVVFMLLCYYKQRQQRRMIHEMDVKIRSKYEDTALKNYLDQSLNRNNSSGAPMSNGHIRSNGYMQVSQRDMTVTPNPMTQLPLTSFNPADNEGAGDEDAADAPLVEEPDGLQTPPPPFAIAVGTATGSAQPTDAASSSHLRPARSADQGYASDHPSNPHSKENSDSSNQQPQPKSNDHGYDSERSQEKLSWQADAAAVPDAAAAPPPPQQQQQQHDAGAYASPYGSQQSRSSGGREKPAAHKKRKKRSKSKETGSHRGSCTVSEQESGSHFKQASYAAASEGDCSSES